MKHSTLTDWLSGLFAILLIVVLVLQTKQNKQLETLRQVHETFASATTLRQQEAHDRVGNLTRQIQTLTVTLETNLLQSTTQRQQEARDTIGNLSHQIQSLTVTLQTNLSQSERNAQVILDSARNALQSQAEREMQSLRAGAVVWGEQLGVFQTNLATHLSATELRIQDQAHEVKRVAADQLTANAQVRDDLQKASSVRETQFRDMNRRLDDLLESGALFPNKSKAAGEARALAVGAENAGDTNLAKIYHLSAINHAPSDFGMLDSYAELVFRDSSATPEDFSRLKSVLQISLYQIPPASVTNALSLLNETVRREGQLLAAQTPKPLPVNWQERFEQLTKSNTLDSSWSDLKKIFQRWDRLNEILQSLHEEQPESDLSKQVEQEFELTQRVLAAVRLTSALDTMMSALNSSSEQPEKAVSLLQSAEATLGQLWGIGSAGWPTALRSKIDQYPKEIQSRVEAIAEFKSRPFLAEVVAERDSANTFVQLGNWNSLVAKGNPYQQVVTLCDGCYERAVAAAQNISSAKGRKKAEAAMKDIRNIALDAKRKQFDAYQKWVVNVCQRAHADYNKNPWGVSWVDLFKQTDLPKVDQSILAPQTSSLFSDVIAAFYEHIKGDDRFGADKDLAERSKTKLEDF